MVGAADRGAIRKGPGHRRQPAFALAFLRPCEGRMEASAVTAAGDWIRGGGANSGNCGLQPSFSAASWYR